MRWLIAGVIVFGLVVARELGTTLILRRWRDGSMTDGQAKWLLGGIRLAPFAAILVVVIVATPFPTNLIIAGVLVIPLTLMIGLGASVFDYGARHAVKGHLRGTTREVSDE